MMATNASTFYFNKYIFRQILLTSVGLLQGVSIGGMISFSSILFPQLKRDGNIILDQEEESWFASSLILIVFITCLITGVIMEWLGRKMLLSIAEIFAFIGWIITMLAYDYTFLISGRVIFGIYGGIMYPVFIAFLGEISVPKYRTIFLICIPMGSTFGTFVSQLLGDYVHWKTIALIFALLSIYNILVLWYIKESYVTYLDRNEINEACKSFEWYRGNDNIATCEFQEVIEKRKDKESLFEVLKMCKNKEFLVPFGITTLVFLTNEATATQAVIFYTSQIVKMIKDDSDFETMATLILNILRIVAVILCSFLVKVSSLRFILVSSGYILGVSLLGTGLFMYLSKVYSEYSIFPILTLCTIVLNAVLYSVGLGPLPSVVCGEMFPQATRSIGSSISASLSFLFLFVVVKCMPMLFTELGPSWTFTIFGVGTLLGITATHFVLPNTQNKTLQDINKLYQT